MPPRLDPPTSRLAPLYSTLLAGSPSPKPAYQDRYSEESPRIGRAFLFGFVTFVLLTDQIFRWWDGERTFGHLPLRATLSFLALVYGSLYALCEVTSIYQLVALDLILFVIVYVSITFGSPETFPWLMEMEDDEVVLAGNQRAKRKNQHPVYDYRMSRTGSSSEDSGPSPPLARAGFTERRFFGCLPLKPSATAQPELRIFSHS